MTNEHRNGENIAQFSIRYHQLLDQHGKAVGELPAFAYDRDTMLALYRTMVLTRTFDNKAIALQRTGKMGTYASVLGQEAVGTAMGHAMRAEDVLCPAYREYAAQLQRGVTMTEILLYWGGDERGMAYQNQAEDLPICVPIATQLPHAAGVASAFKLRQQPRVAVAVLGDGATSKGDFYEALNLAGAWCLPMVIVATNNQWAISVPRKAQCHAETLAQKAIAGGIRGEQVDGNDIIAMRHHLGEAIERARRGEGTTLIEAITYRMGDHTTADDASRYRSQDEVNYHKQFDPIDRFYHFLVNEHGWNEGDDNALRASCSQEVDAAVQIYLDTPPQPVESMFDYLYETLPDALVEQRNALIKRGGGDHG